MFAGSMMWAPRCLPSGEISGHHHARTGASTGSCRPVLSTQTKLRAEYWDRAVPVAYASEPLAPAAMVGIQWSEMRTPSITGVGGPVTVKRLRSNGAAHREPLCWYAKTM